MSDATEYQVSKTATLDNSTVAVIHTVKSPRWLTLSNIHISNTSGSAVTVSIFFVPSGASPAVGNAGVYSFSVPANDFIEFGEGQKLPPKASIQGLAGFANVVSVWVSGIEQCLSAA